MSDDRTQTYFALYGLIRHRMATDGPGVNTLAALAGCPASCRYCLNAKLLKRTDARRVSPEELLEKVMIDACYMLPTGGGVTFGGGEPLLQAKAILSFARIKPDWMKLNVETSLQAEPESVRLLLPFVDRWIIDVKALDPETYTAYTDLSPGLLLDNLSLLRKECPEKCHLRVPDIPGFVSPEQADRSAKELKSQGFPFIERFAYVIR